MASSRNNARDRKALEQQNVLRRVAASREYSKKKQRTTTFKKKVGRPYKDSNYEPTNSTNVEHVEEIKTENNEIKEAADEKVACKETAIVEEKIVEEKIVEEKTVEEKSSEEKVVAVEKVVVEEKVTIVGKVSSAEVLKKWGPRTKGVLFRRQPDGTLINADLT